MSAAPFSVPYPCLVADVGGTNARFAILAGPDAPLSPMFRLDTGSEADFARTTEKAIATGGFPRPRAMLLAVAGPPVGKRAELSNAEVAGGRLTVDGDALAAALGLEQGSSSMISRLFRSRCPSSRRRMSSGWMRGRRPPIRLRRWSWWGRVPGSASAASSRSMDAGCRFPERAGM